uniref:head maturation protease, ClpP-related n=1 Tax=Ilyobacter sp. TaxID=3100343 RepID=UPI0035677663
GEVGEYWAEVTPTQFKKDLDDLGTVDELDVRIHSPGGVIFSGYAIYNLLKTHSAKKTVYVDGIAASMGSIIAMAGDEIKMSKAGMIMIHNPWGWSSGEAKDMRQYADNLDKMMDTAAEIYSERTGTGVDTIKELMGKTTYLTADEALEYGFIDEIIDYSEDTKIDPVNKMLMMDGRKIDLSGLPQQKMLMNKLETLGLKEVSIKEEEEDMTKAELKAKHLDLYNEIYNEGVAEERTRMQEIEELSIPGGEGFLAKYKFEEPKAAGEVSILMLKAIKSGDITPLAAVATTIVKPEGETAPVLQGGIKTGAETFVQKVADAQASGVGKVASSGDGHISDEEKKKQAMQARAQRIAEKANKGRGL